MIPIVLIQLVHERFVQLWDSLRQLNASEYSRPCRNLSGGTIGQHVRHIIELFHCLEAGYESGILNYENRKRERITELDKDYSISLLEGIYERLRKPNRVLLLQVSGNGQPQELISIDTNYYREIVYNLEHTIHHMALIKVGICEVSGLELSPDYGVAGSTIKYRSTCAQ